MYQRCICDSIGSILHLSSEQFLSPYHIPSHSLVLGMEMRGRSLAPIMGLQDSRKRTHKEVVTVQLVLCQGTVLALGWKQVAACVGG